MTTTKTTLGARPTNPAEISFDRRCFETIGTKTQWVVGFHAAAMRSPATFSDEATANAFAARFGRSVSREEVAVERRIAWTLKDAGSSCAACAAPIPSGDFTTSDGRCEACAEREAS